MQFPNLTRGKSSPTFLKWMKKRRIKRQSIKKFLKKKKIFLQKHAFEKIYYEKNTQKWLFNTKEWLLIENRFIKFTREDPPDAIIYWFLDR